MTVHTFDARETSVNINNKFVTGFAEGSFVEWEKDEDNFNSKTDAMGDTAVAITNNNTGTITLTLSQTSPNLKELKRLAESRAKFPIWVKTPAEKVGGTEAMFVKSPSGGLSDEIEDREFEIRVFDYTDQ
ncbi:phage structural protein [Exiguobacterium sp. R-39]|uniref:phage structural protein n=1 Tax=Exiguobacterium sp. R-39 TaxID=3416708 RepID=UPI003CE8E6AD